MSDIGDIGDMYLDIYKSFATELAELSAAAILPWFGKGNISVEYKEDQTPVTQADREAESVMRKAIKENYPDHGIIGEEFGAENEDAEYVWTLDPIDGTKSFISNVPLFGTVISLLSGGNPILGLINQPVLNQLCIGDGNTTTLNGKEIQMRGQYFLSSALLLSSDVDVEPEHQNPVGWKHLRNGVSLHRTWGDCYGYLLVASGWADVMVDPDLEIWDIAGIIPIIEGAGGKITDWKGRPAISANGTIARSAVAAHPDLHREVIVALNKT